MGKEGERNERQEGGRERERDSKDQISNPITL